ncbi:hypothetical protein H6P81_019988 [Aristolochia fimbriata]|uniref:Uncharacterized protein n=1 Tax=Aristolochia fimbriata TaxID=158543 RepID=A0AAV7DTB2_ARIFI|nr:hypothetical protein H6P81_019988 [Aristolochia fimbriata]
MTTLKLLTVIVTENNHTRTTVKVRDVNKFRRVSGTTEHELRGQWPWDETDAS